MYGGTNSELDIRETGAPDDDSRSLLLASGDLQYEIPCSVHQESINSLK
jgi:hypothetical protein